MGCFGEQPADCRDPDCKLRRNCFSLVADVAEWQIHSGCQQQGNNTRNQNRQGCEHRRALHMPAQHLHEHMHQVHPADSSHVCTIDCEYHQQRLHQSKLASPASPHSAKSDSQLQAQVTPRSAHRLLFPMLLIRVGRHAKRGFSSYITALDHAAASQSACGCRGATPAARPVCGAAMAATAVESPAQPRLQPNWSYQQSQILNMLSRGFAKGAAKAKRGAWRASHCMTKE